MSLQYGPQAISPAFACFGEPSLHEGRRFGPIVSFAFTWSVDAELFFDSPESNTPDAPPLSRSQDDGLRIAVSVPL